MTFELRQPFLVVDLIGGFGHIHRLRIKLLAFARLALYLPILYLILLYLSINMAQNDYVLC